MTCSTVIVIIYLPTQREMSSGINEVPVMCTTTERKVIKDDILACRWSSCSEWCLSKGGGACTHLYVRKDWDFLPLDTTLMMRLPDF